MIFRPKNKYGLTLPYEKRIFSQNGEDGIIEHLIAALIKPNKQCVEIGWGKDIVKGKVLPQAINCTQNLVKNHMYQCVAYDLKKQAQIPTNVTFYQTAVTPERVPVYLKQFSKTPDFFSLDIDSYDFFMLEELIKNNFKPKIICVETNRRLGYSYEFAMPYHKKGKYNKELLSGASYKKYKSFLEKNNYKFFTLNSNGLNIFFYDPTQFHEEKLSNEKIFFIEEFQKEFISPKNFVKEANKYDVWKGIITEKLFKY